MYTFSNENLWSICAKNNFFLKIHFWEMSMVDFLQLLILEKIFLIVNEFVLSSNYHYKEIF